MRNQILDTAKSTIKKTLIDQVIDYEMDKRDKNNAENDYEEYDLSLIEEDKLKNIEKITTLKTGISGLDRENTGIPVGLNLIIGTPGSGKSWFMIHLVKVAWELNKQKSAIFTLEMNFEGLKNRLLQVMGDITHEDMVYGKGIDNAAKKLKEIPLRIIDYTKADNQMTHAGFLNKVKSLYEDGVRVFILDHFHEISGASVNDKNQQVAETFGNTFKFIRSTYPDVWLFVLVQSNKDGLKKTFLKKEDMAGSMSLVNKCDYFLSLNRTDKDDLENTDNYRQDKEITFWIDKSRKLHIDKFPSKAILSRTGVFVDVPLVETAGNF
jgi:predicted ATP-dependent serine protease